MGRELSDAEVFGAKGELTDAQVMGGAAARPAAPSLWSRIGNAVSSALPSADRAERALKLGVGNVVDSAGNTVGLFANPLNTVVNAALPGAPLSTHVGEGWSDALGLPQPEGRRERLIHDLAVGAGAGMMTAGAAEAGLLAARAPSVARSFLQFLAEAPVVNSVAGGSGGLASGVTREAGGGELAQTAAGLVGGLAGGIGAHVAGRPRSVRVARSPAEPLEFAPLEAAPIAPVSDAAVGLAPTAEVARGPREPIGDRLARIRVGRVETPEFSPVDIGATDADVGIAPAGRARTAGIGSRARLDAITAATESGGRDVDAAGQVVTSSAGAKGSMQVLDGTNRDPGYGVRPAADDSLAERARVGRDYRAALTDHYGGDPAKGWAAYNAGPGALDARIKRYGDDWLAHMPDETQAYVRKNLKALGREVDAPVVEAPARTDAVEVRTAVPEAALPAGAPDIQVEPLAPIIETPARPAIPDETRAPLTGDSEQVVTARGRPVDTQFEVRELGDLISSEHPAFDPALQPRDRANRSSSDAQIAEIASQLDPEQLSGSRQASQGAPIIGPDRMVESGNGRVAAIRRAYELHPERTAAYREMIEKRGLSTQGFDQPVLVRRRTGELSATDRAAFVKEANERDTMGMSSTEQAKADAGTMSRETLEQYRGGPITHADNRDFVRGWMREVVNPADRNALMKPDGSLSADGVRRMRTSLLAKAFDDSDLVSKIVEDPDANIKAIGTALIDTAPAVASLRSDIEAGHVPPHLSIHGDIAEMAKLISDARDKGMKIGDVLAQNDAFNPISPTVEALIRSAYNDNLTRARSGNKLAEIIRYYAEDARKADAGPSLFGDDVPVVKKEELVDAARRRQEGPSLFGKDEPAGGSDPASGGGRSGADAGGRPAGRALTPAERGELIRQGKYDAADGESGFITADMLLAPLRAAGNLVDWKGLRDDTGALMKFMLKTTKDPKAALRATGDRLSRFASATLYSADGSARSLADHFDAPTLRAFADLFHAEAGKSSGTARTFDEAIDRGTRTRIQTVYDALEPHMKDKPALDRIRDLLATPNAPVAATAAERTAAGKVRDVLKETLEYRRAAGEELGEVSDGYFPRVVEPALVAANPARFTSAAAGLYRGLGMSAADAIVAADAWTLRVMDSYAGLDGGLDHVAATSKPNSAKSRSFGKAADVALKEFYQQDPFLTLTGYIQGSVKRAEEVRRFGKQGAVGSPERAAWDAAHPDKTQWDVMRESIRDEVRASGKEALGVMDRLADLKNSNLGKLAPTNPYVKSTVSMLHTWNQLSKMDRVTVSSLGDLAMGFVRGGPKYGFQHLATSLHQFGRQIVRMKPDLATRYAEAIGTANDAFGSAVMLARTDANYMGTGQHALIDKFYRGVGLQQLTDAGRIAATKTGQRFVLELAHDLVATDARTRIRAAGYLRELGVKDPDAFGSQLRDGVPTPDDILTDRGLAADYATAIMRYVNQSIIMPSRAQKPTWANHPLGNLFFALQGYSYGFKKNVLDRVGRETVAAVKERDPRKLAAASGLAMLVGFQYLNDTYLRPAIFGSNYDFKSETPLQAGMRTIDRAGILGPLSPLWNAFHPTKYNRGPAAALAGPILGDIADQGYKTLKWAFADNENTNTDERAAAGALYDTVLEPAVDALAAGRLRGVARSAAILGTGQRAKNGILPADREAFVSSVAGEKEQ